MKHVLWAEAAGEGAMLALDVEAVIVAAGVVADPLAVGVDVRSVRMAGSVAEITLAALLGRDVRRRGCNVLLRGLVRGLRSAGRNVSAADLAVFASFALGDANGCSGKQTECKNGSRLHRISC
jgi:hypothetical protein